MKYFINKPAINYSGYRKEHSPLIKVYPSKEEILEDLKLLEGDFYYLRLFDCSIHAKRVLEVITEHDLNFKVMLGLSLRAEENHVNHPFFYLHTDDQILVNKLINQELINEIIDLSHIYKEIVSAISIGNEIRSIWSNQRVPIKRMIDIVKEIKDKTDIPITYCEEYQTWIEELSPLSEVVDFISIHTYPAWQGKTIEQAIQTLDNNYKEVVLKYLDKDIIITETGWPTSSHGSRISMDVATINNQKIYLQNLASWSKENDVLVYIFEAFDEPWKGGEDPREPEKNWGIYFENRVKK